ncbi:hypothetical protein EVG22_31235 [Bacillus thuringiensis serovar andalousiensis]|uniref:Cell wall-binding protein n=1 Tax=Bacillus thuringiensis serovar andalousiensis TaxID=257985 RepID=A0A7U1BBC1_BACTU|nr:hypothetical protein EVG22_31235 [Bacillus thuringiensis serovar andalousiensis]
MKAAIDKLNLIGEKFVVHKKTGWQEIENKKYYFGDDGVMETGWVFLYADDDSLKVYHFGDDGVKHRDKWSLINGTWQHFGEQGNWSAPEKGAKWVVENNKRYYIKSNGEKHTGWLEFEYATFYFDNNGVMNTARELQLEGRTYYFRDNGERNYFDPDGYRQDF